MKQRLHTERKKVRDKKKEIPLEPRYAGICKFTTKIFQTPTPIGGFLRIFYIKITKKPSEKRDPTNPFAVHLVNPFISTYGFFCTIAMLSLFRPNPTIQILKPGW
jgi:hypothetical protein